MMDLFGATKAAPSSGQIGLATVGAKYAGDRVLIARVSGSVVVICKIGNPA